MPDGGVAKKKTVKFDAETIDRSDDFEFKLKQREQMERQQTYADLNDSMLLNRTDTQHKKEVMTAEQKRAMIMGPAGKKKSAETEEQKKKRAEAEEKKRKEIEETKRKFEEEAKRAKEKAEREAKEAE